MQFEEAQKDVNAGTILSETDREFLHDMMLERMTQHYADHHHGTARCSREMDKQVMDTLSALPEEQADVLHSYLEHLFERSAEDEALYYRCGLLDGYRLCLYIREKTEGA